VKDDFVPGSCHTNVTWYLTVDVTKKNRLSHHHASRFCTSNESDEDSGHTSKRLVQDFSGAGEVEGTDGEHKKNNISGATGVMGFKTGGLVDTVWNKEASVRIQTRLQTLSNKII
jgi:hypothetical protein